MTRNEMKKTEEKQLIDEEGSLGANVAAKLWDLGEVRVEEVAEFAYLALFVEAARPAALLACGAAPTLEKVRSFARSSLMAYENLDRMTLGVTVGGFALMQVRSTPHTMRPLWEMILFSGTEAMSAQYRELLRLSTGPSWKAMVYDDLRANTVPVAVRPYYEISALQRSKEREVADGYCYMRAFRSSEVPTVVTLLGSAPTEAAVAEVLRTCGRDTADNCALEGLSSGKAHLVARPGSCWTPDPLSSVAVGGTGNAVVDWLCDELHVPDVGIHDGFVQDVQLATRTAAYHDAKGKSRLKLLAMLGDTVLALELLSEVMDCGGTAQEAQERRSMELANRRLSALFSNVFPVEHFLAPAGVDMAKTSAGADAVEAIVGAVYKHLGVELAMDFVELIMKKDEESGRGLPAGGGKRASGSSFSASSPVSPSRKGWFGMGRS